MARHAEGNTNFRLTLGICVDRSFGYCICGKKSFNDEVHISLTSAYFLKVYQKASFLPFYKKTIIFADNIILVFSWPCPLPSLIDFLPLSQSNLRFIEVKNKNCVLKNTIKRSFNDWKILICNFGCIFVRTCFVRFEYKKKLHLFVEKKKELKMLVLFNIFLFLSIFGHGFGDEKTWCAGCSSHCTLDFDKDLSCWNKTLEFYEATLVGGLRHYTAVLVSRFYMKLR